MSPTEADTAPARGTERAPGSDAGTCDPDPANRGGPVLVEGDTCERKVHADRVSFVIDAADYFAAAKQAILEAERCVYLIGWEFDLDIRLRPDLDDPETPDSLRKFLEFAVKQRPDLEIFILQWRGAMLFNIARQLGSYLALKARASSRIHFRLDAEHPAGACHHQKIVVIDDRLAFCGGIDMTSGRWDTCAHDAQDKRRGEAGDATMPWHDMTLALDGEAAEALGELARARWKNATGKDLPVPKPSDRRIWPDRLQTDLTDATLGIALSAPGYGVEEEFNQIGRLWCRAIESARRTIYIENQFLSSGRIARALEARLKETGGPDIVIVLPSSAESWLESEAMDTRRSMILEGLHEADHEGRLGVYYPVNAEEKPIYVHAKLLIADEEFVRVGSSNMASRSFAADTECDLAMEARDQPALGEFLGRLRARLLAEHCDVSIDEVEDRFERSGGRLVQVVEALRKEEGRSLRPLDPAPLLDTERALAESRLLDPEDPIPLHRRLADFGGEFSWHNRGVLAAGALALAGVLAAGAMRRRKAARKAWPERLADRW